MFMKKWHIFFPLGLCLIGGLWAVQKLDLCDIINRESKLIETAGFLFLKSFNVKVEAIDFTIIK